MPFDSTNNVWYGSDAKTPRTTARAVIVEFLRTKLNDPEGPYYAALGLGAAIPGSSEVTRAVVTSSAKAANALYNGAGGRNPIVYAMSGKSDRRASGRVIGGEPQAGVMHKLTIVLDMGVNDVKSTADRPVAEENAESILSDFVTDALWEGRAELAAAGLQNVDCQPDAEMQMAGRGRNPHNLTLDFLALKTWTP